MIEMTLHAVTVRCESLPQALAPLLLDQWAHMGRIQLPPEPARQQIDPVRIDGSLEDVLRRVDGLVTAARATEEPPVFTPSKPPKRKAPGEGLEERPCGVCDVKFECPKGSRLVTCKAHRLKPGQNLAHERAKYQASKGKPGPAASAPAGQKVLPPKGNGAIRAAAAKGLLGRPPIRPTEPTKPCSACGDKTRESQLDAKGRCPDCQPIGGSK